MLKNLNRFHDLMIIEIRWLVLIKSNIIVVIIDMSKLTYIIIAKSIDMTLISKDESMSISSLSFLDLIKRREQSGSGLAKWGGGLKETGDR